MPAKDKPVKIDLPLEEALKAAMEVKPKPVKKRNKSKKK